MPNCPNCGNNKMTKSDKGEYVYYCEWCGSEIDFANHTTIDWDIDRLLKAAHTHLQEGDMGRAHEKINQLRLEFPYDPRVKKLIKMYDDACKKEQNEYHQKQEQNDLSKKREDILRQIAELEKDTFFWKQNKEFNGTYIDIIKLRNAILLLDKAEEYGIKCLTFRKSMWELFEDLQSRRLKIHEREPLENEGFYNMFGLVGFICDDEDELEDAKKDMISSKREWLAEMRHRILFGAALWIIAIVLFLFNKDKMGDIMLTSILALFVFGALFASLALLNIAVYQSPKSALKSIMGAVKEQENNDKLINDDIEEIKQELKEAHEMLDKLSNEFKNITILKQ